MKVICAIASVFSTVLLFSSIALKTSLDSHAKPAHDVAVTNLSVPLSCVAGDTVPVTVSVSNQGTHRESFRVMLTDQTGSKEIASKEVTLTKGWKDGSEDVANLIFDAETNETNELSNSMDSSGDVNGDGCDDLLVNAAYWHGGQGRVYLYFGGRDMDNIADKVFSGEAVGDYFGDVAGTLGDIDGDGFYDVIVGARGYNSSGDGWGDGRVYIYYGAPNMDNIADVILEGEAGQRGCFGSDVKAGDVDNDGYDDLLVGACVMNSWRGKSYLFWGGKPFDRTADVVFEGENENDWFGRQARVGGDVNGDGYNDIIIGAKHWDISGGDDKFGRAYLYYGNTQEKMNGTVDKVFSGETEKDQFSTALDLFDIDNDDFAEVIIGARFAADYHGRVYIYWGAKDFDGSSPDLILEVEAGGNMGCGDIACGYFNHDGFGDIVTGAYNYPNDMKKRGRAYVFNGNTRASMDQLADHLFEGEFGQAGRFGSATVSSDLNDDNYDDIVIGAWGYNNRQGRAYLYYGPFSDTTDITFNWNTTNASPGNHILRASIAPVAGEEDVADNVLTATVNIKTP